MINLKQLDIRRLISETLYLNQKFENPVKMKVKIFEIISKITQFQWCNISDNPKWKGEI